jgi:hypothetical protein
MLNSIYLILRKLKKGVQGLNQSRSSLFNHNQGSMKNLTFILSLLIGQSLVAFSQDSIHYVFAETFENIPDLSRATILKTWQIHQTNYMEGSQSIRDIGDGHGKVWHSVYHEGLAAGYGDDGFAIDIPVGGEYDELWFESDLYADPDFNPYSVTGKFSGKMLFGFTGGNEYLTNGHWELDSSATGNGWTAQGVWGSDYALRPYYYDQIADGQTHQLNANLVIPRGYWIHITRRVKMNTPGKKDGIFEVYINDSLRAQATDVEWRSKAQGADYGKISHLHLTFFFGGGGADFASQRDNFIRVDNMVAYYYTPNAKSYLYGAAPAGHKVPRNIPKNDIYPPKILYDEVFTKPAATIKSHYNAGVFTPTYMGCIKKEIKRPEGPIKLTFTAFEAGCDNSATENSYTKVYSGTGDSKALLYTFDRYNVPGGTYTIDNKEVTIEFFAGHSNSKGFALNYTSPGADETPVDVNNPPVINNQQFIIKELEFSNNYVGKLVAYDNDVNQQLTYSITSGNQSGLFKLDSKTGQLTTTKSNVFDFDLTEYNLVIQVTDNGSAPKSASASVNVKFIARTSVVYIDPSKQADPAEDGTISHPYNSWSDVAWNDGTTYLQKNGTIATESSIIIGANNVTLDSYGEGEPPVIKSATKDYLISGFEKSNVTIHNLNLQAASAVSCVYFLGGTSVNITVEQCTLEGFENAFRAMDCQSVIFKYNTITAQNEGIYSTASRNDIFYNVFKNNKSSVNIVGTYSKANIFNNVFINNVNAITASYAEMNLYNNIFYMIDNSQKAISYDADKITSDNNIFYPEQDGFVEIAGEEYSTLNQVQEQTDLEEHSLNSDPLFVDVNNDNYTLETFSPAVNAGINLNLGYDFFGQEVPVAGLPDIGIAEYTGNASEEKDVEPKLMLYPNPSTGYVNIEADLTNTDFDHSTNALKTSNNNSSSEIKVMDMDGKMVFSKIVESTESIIQTNIDLTGKLNGLYLIILSIADKTITSKLTLNR